MNQFTVDSNLFSSGDSSPSFSTMLLFRSCHYCFLCLMCRDRVIWSWLGSAVMISIVRVM